jgi:hypothetical protein
MQLSLHTSICLSNGDISQLSVLRLMLNNMASVILRAARQFRSRHLSDGGGIACIEGYDDEQRQPHFQPKQGGTPQQNAYQHQTSQLAADMVHVPLSFA